MKQRIQLLSVVLTVASTGLAFGCGCSSGVSRVQPVRELIIEKPSYTLAPVAERVTTCSTVTYQNKCIGSDLMLLPIGDRYRTWKTAHDAMFAPAPVGERVIIEKSYQSEMLPPVSEQLITVKTYHKTLLKPVGERIIIEKSYHKGMIRPVGERFTTLKSHRVILKPVGERSLHVKGYHKTMLKPVGEKGTIIKSQKVWLKKPMSEGNLKKFQETSK